MLFVKTLLLVTNVTINSDRKGRKEMFYLTTNSTHFIYGYMASDIWLRIILIVRKETRCRHIGYSFRLAARVLLYASSHRQDDTYHGVVTPVVEHWLERQTEKKRCKYIHKYYSIRPNAVKYHDLFCNMNIHLLTYTCKIMYVTLWEPLRPHVDLVLYTLLCYHVAQTVFICSCVIWYVIWVQIKISSVATPVNTNNCLHRHSPPPQLQHYQLVFVFSNKERYVWLNECLTTHQHKKHLVEEMWRNHLVSTLKLFYFFKREYLFYI